MVISGRLFFLLSLHYSFVFSAYIPKDDIALLNAAKKCCASDLECCVKHMKGERTDDTCSGFQYSRVADCAEFELWGANASQLSLGVEACCEFLEQDECHDKCLNSLRAISHKWESRLTFYDYCHPAPYVHNDSDCLSFDRRKLHSCFGDCIAIQLDGRDFEAGRDCLDLVPIEQRTPCFVEVILEKK